MNFKKNPIENFYFFLAENDFQKKVEIFSRNFLIFSMGTSIFPSIFSKMWIDFFPDFVIQLFFENLFGQKKNRWDFF